MKTQGRDDSALKRKCAFTAGLFQLFCFRQGHVQLKNRNIAIFLLKLYGYHLRINLYVFTNDLKNIFTQLRQIMRFCIAATAFSNNNLQPFFAMLAVFSSARKKSSNAITYPPNKRLRKPFFSSSMKRKGRFFSQQTFYGICVDFTRIGVNVENDRFTLVRGAQY